MNVFVLNTNKDIWRKFVIRLFWDTIDFHSRRKNTALFPSFFRISSFVFRTNTFIQVWIYLRMSKWWQTVHFWVYCLFNPLTVTVPPFIVFFPIKYFSNHHQWYIITSKFILWKPFWNRTLRYHGNGTLKCFSGLLPLSGRSQVSYYFL